MHRREQQGAENAAADTPARRVVAPPDHPLLTLQREAGNAAVAGLVGAIPVQRIWPFDDEDEDGDDEAPDEEPEEEPEEEPDEDQVPANPGGMPNDPTFVMPVEWYAGATPGALTLSFDAASPMTAVQASSMMVHIYGLQLPYEPLPQGHMGGGFFEASVSGITRPPADAMTRQALRATSGQPSPDIDRIVHAGEQPSAPGGPQSPGPAPAPGGPAAPAGPDMQPVTPGQGPGAVPAPTPGAAPTGSLPTERPMLRRGSRGTDVSDAQGMLNNHGATLDVDGIFGGGTQAAVIEFQRARNLGADGIIGPLTWAALQLP